MSAIAGGSEEMVRACLDSGMNPFVRDCSGRSCLEYAKPFASAGAIVEILEASQTQ